MPSGASIDWEGRPVTEEEVAKGLGFVNVEAFRWWQRTKEKLPPDQFSFLVAEIANLRETLKIVADQASIAYGQTARIG